MYSISYMYFCESHNRTGFETMLICSQQKHFMIKSKVYTVFKTN